MGTEFVQRDVLSNNRSYQMEGLLMLNKEETREKNPVVTFSCEALPFNKSQLNRNTQRSVCYKLQHSDDTQVIHL